MNFKQECKFFLTDRPCKFHKIDPKIVCEKCKNYVPIVKEKYNLNYATENFKLNKEAIKINFQKQSPKILVIKLAALGDVVRTTSLLKPLFKKYNNPKIYWVTYKESVSILKNNKYIKKVYEIKDFKLKVKNYLFDIMMNLDLDKDALELTKLVKSEEKFGFYLNNDNYIICSNSWAEKWFELSHNDNFKKKNKITYQEYMLNICDLKYKNYKDYPIIVNLTKKEIQFAKQFAAKNNIRDNDFIIGINTGGGSKWPKKEWPIKNTVELIKKIVENKIFKDKIKILLFGGKKEKERNKKILENLMLKIRSSNIVVKNKNLSNVNYLLSGKVIDTGINNSLRELFALLNLCNLVIVTDTLALHISLGLKKNVIVLFGPTASKEIETYGLGKKIVAPINCVVCYSRTCTKSPYCMEKISSSKVFNQIKSLCYINN